MNRKLALNKKNKAKANPPDSIEFIHGIYKRVCIVEHNLMHKEPFYEDTEKESE